ncbi:hypothetical protein LPJ78_003393 [Coemansia sp. RSA 989]|nr:ribonuclease H-like domain-containing protein [Coemansia mojavensis]KAJ1741810.1 hypothetical protein LPJ68_002477 [Coemansia sp. RSA 1086]KAJ1749887.1 hypothetical protein LPJ79_003382 [Coemansia sp. RSA 1821]KAJ1864378.1 hypothetical protein LPJ78_003393 [Coemansia sp. RSA 989]KAJ1874951.1 hypothetical protein LPJ55_001026 [Coemansia sp. RSA 990]KAJ2652778.1 hypothetical protein IWW40_000891 [Coemansia sp. RSA 1250]KAJ2675386.1 hypothetical protein IWW42_001172 [Coemansia sp. RSA 1085]
MDVTRENFGKALAKFTQAVAECDFAALDMEMTGLYETREHQPSRLDTREQRYQKLKRSVEAYGVIQVGICLFTWTTKDGVGFYEAQPFNFNVFPASSVGGVSVDEHFGCKTSAFEFLAKNAFDFNKWVYQGIPFLRGDTAERIRSERTLLLTSRQRSMTPDDCHADFVVQFEAALAKFMASADKTLRYDAANTYERRLIYDIVRIHDTLGTRSRAGCIEIFKGSRKAMQRHIGNKVQQFSACVDEARGFTDVIERLSAARKPVVGHNMLLDVLHAYSKFVAQLPPTFAEFERAVAGFLPALIDTKFIIESTPGIKARYGTSNLDEIAPLLERDCAGPIRFHPHFHRNVSHNMHEAGFDAYMTGSTFVRLLNLGSGGLGRAPELVLYRYLNKLYASTAEGISLNL